MSKSTLQKTILKIIYLSSNRNKTPPQTILPIIESRILKNCILLEIKIVQLNLVSPLIIQVTLLYIHTSYLIYSTLQRLLSNLYWDWWNMLFHWSLLPYRPKLELGYQINTPPLPTSFFLHTLPKYYFIPENPPCVELNALTWPVYYLLFVKTVLYRYWRWKWKETYGELSESSPTMPISGRLLEPRRIVLSISLN